MDFLNLYTIFFTLVMASLVQPVSAFDAGDTIALLLGLFLGFFGIFACIGVYARKRGSQI